MTPVLLKPCPTDAISDSAENLRKLSALRAEVSGQSGGNDASLLSCFSFRPPQSRGSPPKIRQKAARKFSPGQGHCPAPKEATQRLTGANMGVIQPVPPVFAVPVGARQQLRQGTDDAGYTTLLLRE